MDARRFMAMALDPGAILRARGFTVDPWQHDVLLCKERQILLNCCRQAGKSTVVSALALHHALFVPKSTVLILSPVQRQSSETFRKVLDGYKAIDRPLRATYETQLKIEFQNDSRILCMPGVEESVRCYSPNLIIIDEAARVDDDLYRAIRPILAVSQGRLVCLSTPFGQRGWFFDEWQGQGPGSRSPPPGATARASAPTSSPRRSGRWAGRGSPRSTSAASRRWRGWSIPTSRSA